MILMDVQMPVMDGVRRPADPRPAAAETGPIIALTADAWPAPRNATATPAWTAI